MDLDRIRQSWPAPAGDRFNFRLLLRNLRDLTANYLDAGVRSIVLAGGAENQAERDAYQAALGIPLQVCRLTADLPAVHARLRHRHSVVMGLVPLLTERGASTTPAAWAPGLGGAGRTLGRTLYATLARGTTRTTGLLAAGGATTAALALVPGPLTALTLIAVAAGLIRGNLTLLRATAVTDRWGTTHYGRLVETVDAEDEVEVFLGGVEERRGGRGPCRTRGPSGRGAATRGGRTARSFDWSGCSMRCALAEPIRPGGPGRMAGEWRADLGRSRQ